MVSVRNLKLGKMKMPNFEEILSKKAAEVEKPKPKPTGSYQAQVMGMPKQKVINVQGEEVPILSFTCKVIAPMKDVDEDQLAAAGDLSSWPPFNKDFWLNGENGVWAATQFLTSTLDIEEGDKTLGQLCTEAPGKQLVVTLKHRPYQNKDTGDMEIATEIGSTAKL